MTRGGKLGVERGEREGGQSVSVTRRCELKGCFESAFPFNFDTVERPSPLDDDATSQITTIHLEHCFCFLYLVKRLPKSMRLCRRRGQVSISLQPPPLNLVTVLTLKVLPAMVAAAVVVVVGAGAAAATVETGSSGSPLSSNNSSSGCHERCARRLPRQKLGEQTLTETPTGATALCPASTTARPGTVAVGVQLMVCSGRHRQRNHRQPQRPQLSRCCFPKRSARKWRRGGL
jgi:hypothetical protein